MLLEYFNDSRVFNLTLSSVIFIGLFLILFFVTKYIFKRLKRYVSRSPSRFDDFMLDIFRVPALWFLFWILFKIFSVVSLNEFVFASYLAHINNVLLILLVAWILTKFVKAGAYYLQNNLDMHATDNLHARKSLTQIKVFQHIANTIIVIVALSISLLTFDEARTIGMSLLTSAGILGIIVGFAAQKSIGMILAGIQIAITQPIRINDIVVVEGETGQVEELTLTYVVIKIWDERRLILPVNYFLEKPFQNWTRTGSEIMGTVFLQVDYSFPVDSIRTLVATLVANNPNWDGRLATTQVTESTANQKEIRILVSSADSGKNWELRVFLREKLIDYMQTNHPQALAYSKVKLL